MVTAASHSLTENIINMEQDYVVQTYNRPPFVLTHGDGMYVYDADGNEYLDFVAGIAVNSLGYNDPGLVDALQKAATGLLHVSNLYHTAPHAELAAMLVEKSFADRVQFSNSGTEANEAAIKYARKVAYDNGKPDKTEIVCFANAFHGRTFGSLALTPKEKYQKPYQPLMPGAMVAEFNDIDSVKAVIGDKTAAVIIEPVQGEGGINPATPEFLTALRELCDEHDALLIFDEIQCGVGRTGTLWSNEPSGIQPDIMTLAKPLAGGLPIGAVLTTNAVAEHINPGDHGSTFAGGPLVTAVAKYVLARISQPEFLAQVRAVGDYLVERLEEINSPHIKEVRGRGLMVGLEFHMDAAPLISGGYRHGLLLVNAGQKTVRFVPPLIAENRHVDAMVERLTAVLGEVNHG